MTFLTIRTVCNWHTYEPSDICALVESHGFEGNIRYAFFSNLKPFGLMFRVPEDVLVSVAGVERVIDGAKRFARCIPQQIPARPRVGRQFDCRQ